MLTGDSFIHIPSKVPNVQEAQASGRTLNIMIKVQVMKDSEVINIDLQLTNNVNA